MTANFGDALRRLIMPAAAAVSLAAVGATVTNADLVPLPGNVHQFARPQFDAGEAPATLRPKGLDIVFAKTPEQERALQQLLAAQQDPKSPQYHEWLTPAQYGVRFGASDETLAAVTNWLKSNGLSVGQVPPARGHLPFSGSKAQVEAALHTRIHLFTQAGEQHYANVSAPLIPASLTSAISGIRGLNDFHPRPGVHPRKPMPRGSIPLLGHSSARSVAAPDTYYQRIGSVPGICGPDRFRDHVQPATRVSAGNHGSRRHDRHRGAERSRFERPQDVLERLRRLGTELRPTGSAVHVDARAGRLRSRRNQRWERGRGVPRHGDSRRARAGRAADPRAGRRCDECRAVRDRPESCGHSQYFLRRM